MPADVRAVLQGRWKRKGTAASVLIVGGLGFAAARLLWPDGATEPRAALMQAVGDSRPLEARLSGGFGYGVWQGPKRTAGRDNDDARRRPPPDLIKAIAGIRLRDRGQRNVPQLQALASAHLILGETDEAVILLEEAIGLDPSNPGVLTDLAAAYVTRADRPGQADDVARGLAMAERALRVSPAKHEALFNRALALEQIPLVSEAIEAWTAYIEQDRSSPWGLEAKRRVDALSRDAAVLTPDAVAARLSAARSGDDGELARLVEADAQAVREALEERLWPEWAAAVRGSSPDATRLLDIIDAVGRALATHAADRLTADTVAAITRTPNPVTRAAVARGFTTYSSAKRLYGRDLFAEARPLFEQSHRELIEAGSPFAAMAAFHQGLTFYYERQTDAAVQRFDEAIAIAQQHAYSALLGRALWVRGLIRPMPMGVTERLRNYQDAMAAFTRAREPAHIAMVHVLLAETHQFFGDFPTAWMHRRQSLTDFHRITDRRRQHSTLIEAARAAAQQKLPETAAHFAHAALDAAVAWQHPVALAESYRECARAALDTDQIDRAADYIEKARQSLSKIPDVGMAARLEPFVQTTSAEVAVARDPQRARSLIADASRKQREAGRGQYLSRLALLSAKAWLVEGRAAQAIADLHAGIEEIETQREAITDPRLRQTYLSDSWLLHKAMIELQVAQHQPDAALEVAERGRARALLDQGGGDVRAPLDANSIRRQMPEGVAALVYVVLDTQILAWVLRRDGGTLTTLPMSRALTRTLVQGLRSAIETSDAPATERFAGALYDRLIEPLSGALRDGDSLVIVPDDMLNEVAWNVLRRGTDTKAPMSTDTAGASHSGYLAARHSITLAPSVSAFLSLRSRAKQPTGSGRVVVVTTTDAEPALPALMFARREAQSLASIYPGLTSIDAAKTPRASLSRLFASSEMIHFALHAFPGTPAFEPHFVLAGGSKALSDRLLTASDIEAMELPNTRLVVLAACSTARGPISQADGPFSLASAFLSAGVPAVVATQWDVDDRATAELLTRFHTHLARTGSALLALQAAQDELRRHADEAFRQPRSWASFVLVGTFK